MPSAVGDASSGRLAIDIVHPIQEEPMDPTLIELELRLRHRHSDGSWAPLAEVSRSHDPAGSDPERSWGVGRLFRCTRCAEEVVVETDEPPARPGGRG
jgi:hypothetical protein